MTSSMETTPKSKILWLQWIGGIGAMIAVFVNSLMKGWSSPYVAKLTAEDSPLPIDLDEASWIVSLLNLGRLVGGVVGAPSVYYIGSKKTLLMSGFPLALGWVLTIVANSVIWLYVARFACGIAMGIMYSSFPLYLGEVSSPSIRGTLVTLAMSGVNLGVLSGNVIGAYVSMSTFSYVSLVPTVIFILIFVWLPDTPHDLTRMDKVENAKKSIKRYNPMVDAETEVIVVKEFVSATNSTSLFEKLKEFNLPQNRKSGFILVALFFFMQFAGLNTVIFYMETILTDAQMNFIDPATMVIIVNAIGTVTGYLATYTADKFGRKTLLIGSSAGVCVSMIALGLHFILIDNGFDSNALQWLPVVSLMTYQLLFPFGVGIVPYMILSELFAPNIKSLAACLGGIATGGFAFASSKTYQPMINTFGEAYVFFIHAAIMAVCIVFCLVLMPETKGKTLQEIQDIPTKK